MIFWETHKNPFALSISLSSHVSFYPGTYRPFQTYRRRRLLLSRRTSRKGVHEGLIKQASRLENKEKTEVYTFIIIMEISPHFVALLLLYGT
jgi:hypothetical protein